MKSVEKTLEYHELLMTCDDIGSVKSYELPKGFSFVFWQSDKDLDDWIRIHIESGEFMSTQYAHSVFHDFYNNFYDELGSRCFFIVDSNGNKIATSTVSPVNEFGYGCVVDWLAISKSHQGLGFAKPLISKTLQTAQGLGYDKILLHTQTHSWLAAKLYLDLGFNPFCIDSDIKGWQILKRLTYHNKLQGVPDIKYSEIFFNDAINIVNNLDKLFGDYEYTIWHTKGRHEVDVRANSTLHHFIYSNNGNTLTKLDI